MSRSRIFLLAGLLLLAGLFAVWRLRAPPSPPDTPVVSDSPADVRHPVTRAPNAEVLQPGLPAADVRVSEALPTLKQRADAGDARAACRLGVELLRCRQADGLAASHAEDFAMREAALRRDGANEEADDLALVRDHFLQVAAECKAVPDTDRALAHRYLRQAALAGEPEALLRYASGQAIVRTAEHEILDTPELRQWRQEAPALLQRALSAGLPEAVHLLAEAYRPAGNPWSGQLGDLIVDDPVQAQAYELLLHRLQGGVDEPVPTPTTPLSADQQLRAETLARQWHQRHFDSGRVDRTTSRRRIAELYNPYSDLEEVVDQSASCEPRGQTPAP